MCGEIGALYCGVEFLKENEANIRECIGEAVPTIIMQKIAKNQFSFNDFLSQIQQIKKCKQRYYF